MTICKSDASGDEGNGYGIHSDHHTFFGRWRPGGTKGHGSFFLELAAIREGVRALASNVSPNGLLIVGCDNTGAVMALNAGRASGNAEANLLIRDIFDLRLAWEGRFDIIAVWVPREDNVVADALSKLPAAALRENWGAIELVHPSLLRR